MTHEIVMDRAGRVLVDGEPGDRDAAMVRFAAESAEHGVPILVAVTEPRSVPRLFHIDAEGEMTPATARTETPPAFSSLLDPVRDRAAQPHASTGRTAVTKPCANCRAVMPAELRWCGECGHSLLPAAPRRSVGTSVGFQRLLADVRGQSVEPSAPAVRSEPETRPWPVWKIAAAVAAASVIGALATVFLLTATSDAQAPDSDVIAFEVLRLQPDATVGAVIGSAS